MIVWLSFLQHYLLIVLTVVAVVNMAQQKQDGIVVVSSFVIPKSIPNVVVKRHPSYQQRPVILSGFCNDDSIQKMQHSSYTNSCNYRSPKKISYSRMNLIIVPTDLDSTATIWISVVEYFDGSNIIDPVVVSNVFWSRLQGNIISVIIGQFLAAIVFSFVLSIATSQISNVFTVLSEQIFKTSTSSTSKQQQQQEFRVPRNLRDTDDTVSKTSTLIQPDIGKLVICLAIDTIGSSSILLPFIGDASDVLWAPTAGLLLRYLFYNSNILLLLEFTEEILPLTDIIPLATLCWIVDTYFRDSSIANLLQLGVYTPSITDKDRSDAIDIDDIRSNNRPNRR